MEDFALRIDASKPHSGRAHEQPIASDRTAKSDPQESAFKRVTEQCFARSSSEDPIWQSEVRRKVVAGGVPVTRDTPSDMSMEAIPQDLSETRISP